MKKLLRILALLVLLAAIGTWLATGANRGWDKDSVQVKTLDPVTGIEAISYQPKFMPGVEFLGKAFIIAGALAGASFLFRSKNKNKTETKQ